MGIFDGGKKVSDLGEKALIKRICERLALTCPPPPRGSGDDCAVCLRESFCKNIFTTVDSVVYGRHFDEASAAELVGRKLFNRNASDIASMGGYPECAVCAAVMSSNVSIGWLDSFVDGLRSAAAAYSTKIIGGDIADSGMPNFFSMSLTLVGSSDFEPLLRGGAAPGDLIYTTGPLGYSFESGRHLVFEPLLGQGRWLAELNAGQSSSCRITSCTDISDGLASDISNILSPDTKALLENIPLYSFNGSTSLKKALCDGEDYQLLFSLRAPESAAEAFEKSYERKFRIPLYRIGRVERRCAGEPVVWIKTASDKFLPFESFGFEHFR